MADKLQQIKERIERVRKDAVVGVTPSSPIFWEELSLIIHSDAPMLVKVAEAAKELNNFLENEKETTSPPEEFLSENCVACESSADYEREEKLSEALTSIFAQLEKS